MPTTPSEFETQNLEAHVQICGERYRALNLRMDNMDQSIANHNDHDKEVHEAIKDRNADLNATTNLKIDNLEEKCENQAQLIKTLQSVLDKNEARMITWGVGIIATLFSGLAYIIAKHIIL